MRYITLNPSIVGAKYPFLELKIILQEEVKKEAQGNVFLTYHYNPQ
jgi:hypothetical protein